MDGHKDDIVKDATYFLRYLQEEIHTTVFATVDKEGLPATCVIDIMLADSEGLYFITAKGKNFYDRLITNPYVAISGFKGHDTLSTISISVRGKVRDIGSELLPLVFERNPYMADIYPTETSRSALTVFQLYEGTGEWFDLSKLPCERFSFAFGGDAVREEGYFVTEACIGCKLCYNVCPQKCIDIDTVPVIIRQRNCIRCGNCRTICPKQAIIRR